MAVLALFDTYPGKMESRGSQLKNLFSLPLKEQASFVLKKGSFVMMTLEASRTANAAACVAQRATSLRQSCCELRRGVVQRSSDTVSGAREIRRQSNDPYAIWWRVAAAVDLREISGDHLSLLKEPQVRFLGEELGDCLAQSATERSLVASWRVAGLNRESHRSGIHKEQVVAIIMSSSDTEQLLDPAYVEDAAASAQAEAGEQVESGGLAGKLARWVTKGGLGNSGSGPDFRIELPDWNPAGTVL